MEVCNKLQFFQILLSSTRNRFHWFFTFLGCSPPSQNHTEPVVHCFYTSFHEGSKARGPVSVFAPPGKISLGGPARRTTALRSSNKFVERLHLQTCLVTSWCGAGRTIWNCCWPWGIASPSKAVAPWHSPKEKWAKKWINDWINESWDFLRALLLL